MERKAAKIENGIVTQVIIGTKEWAEQRLGGTWMQVDELNVGRSYTYNKKEGFRPPKPGSDWEWDGDRWVNPKQDQKRSKDYWDEEIKNWTE